MALRKQRWLKPFNRANKRGIPSERLVFAQEFHTTNTSHSFDKGTFILIPSHVMPVLQQVMRFGRDCLY